MALSHELLIICSRLPRDEYAKWLTAEEVGPQLDLATAVAARDRLNLARSFLESAERLANDAQHPEAAPGEIDSRNAVSRAYYACHHAARALLLHHERGDRSGHQEAIEALRKAASQVEELKTRFGDPKDLRMRLIILMKQRHRADYDPYGADDPKETPVDFAAAAAEAVDFARQLVEAVDDCMKRREEERS